MRRLLLLLLLPATALAEQPALTCVPLSEARCEGGSCVTTVAAITEVTFQPEPTPVEQCRALTCEPAPPEIAICGFAICGAGTVHYDRQDDVGDCTFRTGIAYIAPEPPPRLYASMHFALAYDSGSGRLALSRFDGTSLQTTWLACSSE